MGQTLHAAIRSYASQKFHRAVVEPIEHRVSSVIGSALILLMAVRFFGLSGVPAEIMYIAVGGVGALLFHFGFLWYRHYWLNLRWIPVGIAVKFIMENTQHGRVPGEPHVRDWATVAWELTDAALNGKVRVRREVRGELIPPDYFGGAVVMFRDGVMGRLPARLQLLNSTGGFGEVYDDAVVSAQDVEKVFNQDQQ